MKKIIITLVVLIIIGLTYFGYSYWKLTQTVKFDNAVIQNFVMSDPQTGLSGFSIDVYNSIQAIQKVMANQPK